MEQTKSFWSLIIAVALLVLIAGISFYPNKTPKEELKNMETENTNTVPTLSETPKSAVIKTNMGDISVEFFADEAPITVENFVKLAGTGFYDGVRFHRVIKDFMIQTGDPLSKDVSMKSKWGTGGPGYAFKDEINNKKIVKGVVAMANSGPNTNGSQFFIVTAEATPWLDGKHTAFAMVTDGLDIVEKIGNVATGVNDTPLEDVIIESIVLK